MSACGVASSQSAPSPRLATLDATFRTQSLFQLQPVIDSAYTPEFQAAGIASALKNHAEAAKLSPSSPSSAITSESIANAFDDWVNVIGAGESSYVKPSDVSAHRIFLSHFAHSLIPRAKNSAVHRDLSPAEGLYLLDRLISHGGCPRLTTKDRAAGHYTFDPSTDKALAGYRDAVHAYYASTKVQQREADIRAVLLRAHLL